MPPLKISAPASEDFTRRAKAARIVALRAKATSSRTAAETKELIDSLVSLLPPGTFDPPSHQKG
jgi:hypothetical protein